VNADGLFRPGAGEREPGISQADLMKVLGHGQDNGNLHSCSNRRDSPIT
jgi:hypothetical protein